MKKIYTSLLFAILIALSTTSCEKMRFEGEETWRIASTTTFDRTVYNDSGTSATFHYENKYLYKKQNADGSEPDKWTILSTAKRVPNPQEASNDTMAKFDDLYEEGYEYLIEVKIYRASANEDDTYVRFKSIVFKEKKESYVTPDNVIVEPTPGGFGER
jgi:hypothetical protein